MGVITRSFPPHPNPLPPGERVGHSSAQQSWAVFNRYFYKSYGIKPDELFSYVVTNAHVVKDASSASVLQSDNRYEANIEYIDNEFDLALLIVGLLLPVSPPSSGAQLKVGERVFAIGSPFGLENSISEGIISGKREQNGVVLLQTTAPISKGSSGGGLFDTKGRFVGVTTFKLVGGENLNFAVDAYRVSEVKDAQDAADNLYISAKRTGHFSRDEMKIISSGALTKWVLNTRTENGGKLSARINLRWQEAMKSTQANLLIKVHKENVQIVEWFLKEQSGTIKPEAPQESVSADIPSEKKFQERILSLPCHGSAPADILYCLETLAGTALPSKCIGTTAEQIYYCGYFKTFAEINLSKERVEAVPDENYKEAILYYNIAIQVDSKYIPAYVARAEAYLKLGNYQQAIKDWETAAKLGDLGAQSELRRRGIN